MAITVTALSGQHLNPHAFRFSRTQREAGLEWFSWEGRLRPQRPLFHDIVIGGLLAIAAIAAAIFLI